MKPRDQGNLYSLFAAHAASRGDAVALCFADGNTTSWRALSAKAELLAGALVHAGVARGDVVAIFHGKHESGYALMLACLRLGAACVNLDEQNPPARLAHILDTCRPCRIFSDGGVGAEAARACADWGTPVVDLADRLVVGPHTCLPAVEAVRGTDLAYIMFTSGSTGIPKGVPIAHAQVLNLIEWARDEFSIGPSDLLTNVNPMYFDNSIFDFYASLFNGAALAPLPRALVQEPRALVERVGELGCTLWFSVPSLLIYLTTTRVLGGADWASMRTIVFGGEGYPVPELRKLHAMFGHRVRLVNVYGPTECTCICSAHDVQSGDLAPDRNLPPIGRLAPEFRGLLLDGDQPVLPGEAGELCLLGVNVAEGYYRDATRSAGAFFRARTEEGNEVRMYRTGDLMRIDPRDGLLYFSGRADNQIKHMGYRIELEEIEAALSRLAGVNRAAVVYKRDHASFGNIVAFIASASGALTEAGIQSALSTSLPQYMIPRRVEIRNDLPLNANGKIDRQKLLEEA